jgi:hypothetical protein
MDSMDLEEQRDDMPPALTQSYLAYIYERWIADPQALLARKHAACEYLGQAGSIFRMQRHRIDTDLFCKWRKGRWMKPLR